MAEPTPVVSAAPAIQLLRFQPNLIEPGSNVFIIGKRCTGKDVLMADVLARMAGTVDFTFAVQPLCADSAALASPGCANVSVKHLDALMNAFVESNTHVERLGPGHVPHVCGVLPEGLDQLVNRLNTMDLPRDNGLQCWTDIVRKTRKARTTLFHVMQFMSSKYATWVAPEVDYVFLLDPVKNIETDRKRLWTTLFSKAVPSFADFCSIVESMAPYDAIVLDKRNDLVYWYRASLLPSQRHAIVNTDAEETPRDYPHRGPDGQCYTKQSDESIARCMQLHKEAIEHQRPRIVLTKIPVTPPPSEKPVAVQQTTTKGIDPAQAKMIQGFLKLMEALLTSHVVEQQKQPGSSTHP